MDDKITRQWLAIIRRYVDKLPDGYLKREFYEDFVQEIFCRFLSSYGSRLEENIYLPVRLYNFAKAYIRLFSRSLQKIYEREHLCAAPPRDAGALAEWANNAAMQGNYLVEMWFDLQKFAIKNLTAEEKAVFYRKFKGQPLEIAALGKEESRQVINKLYLKLRRKFIPGERPFRGYYEPCS